MGEDQAKPKREPTIRDVAELCGMSVVTVSRVINNHPRIKESTKLRVTEAMRKLNYHPDAAAQSMRRGSSRIIGFLTPDFTDGVSAIIAQQVGQVARDSGYTLMVACSDFEPGRETEAIHKFMSARVDGIVFHGSNDVDRTLVETLGEAQCPVVLVDRQMAIGADSALSNHYECMRKATRYLLDLGHRDIGFVAASTAIRPGRERRAGFLDEMAARGVPVAPERVFTDGQAIRHGYAAMRTMLAARRPSAVIAGGNQILYGVIAALREHGLSFPQDISLVGADHPRLASAVSPGITMMNRDVADLGRQAVSLLLDRIAGRYDGPPRTVMQGATLTLSDSCRPFANGVSSIDQK